MLLMSLLLGAVGSPQHPYPQRTCHRQTTSTRGSKKTLSSQAKPFLFWACSTQGILALAAQAPR